MLLAVPAGCSDAGLTKFRADKIGLNLNTGEQTCSEASEETMSPLKPDGSGITLHGEPESSATTTISYDAIPQSSRIVRLLNLEEAKTPS